MAIICGIEFFSWFALFFWGNKSSTWWQLTVYDGCIGRSDNDPFCLKGSPQQLRAKSGKDYASTTIYANMIQMVFPLLLSWLVMAGILKKVKYCFSAGLATGATFFIFLLFIKGVPFAWLTSLSFPIAVSVIQSFPFSLIGSYNDGLESGVQMGIMNLFICSMLSY